MRQAVEAQTGPEANETTFSNEYIAFNCLRMAADAS